MLLEEVKITAEAPSVSSTTTIDSSAYDMAGFDGIMFVVRVGTTAANNDIRLRQSSATGGTYADLTGTKVVAGTNNQLMVDLFRPGKQFIKCQVQRGTATTIDALVALQYKGRTGPVTQPATSSAERWITPAEGTA